MADLLAGYIGASRVDLAQADRKQGEIRLTGFQRYKPGDFNNLDSILELYLRKTKKDFSAVCLGVAGPVIKNKVTTTNLPWHISRTSIQKKFAFGEVKLINDVVATAHGLALLDQDNFFMNNEATPEKNGNIGLIAAGSGLGQALIYTDGTAVYPYASEGGHCDFAPGSQLETELWEYLYSELGNVEVEDIVSLSGLERIYNFLVDTQGGTRSDWFENASDRPSAIIEKALSGSDETATHTLDVFIDCYASEAANLALKGMTLGGVYISGMIAPRIITALDKGRFVERFVKRGKMEGMLKKIPVAVIIEERAALIGAANVALNMQTS